MNHIKKKGKVLYSSILTTILSLLVVSSIHADSGLSTLYHVYINDEHIGTVSSQEVVEEFIEKERKKKEATYGDLTLTINENITYVPEMSYNPTYNNSLVEAELADRLTYSVVALQVEIKDETIGLFKNESEVNQLFKKVKAKYVPEEVLANLDTDLVQVEQDDLTNGIREEDSIVQYKLRSAKEKDSTKQVDKGSKIVNVGLSEEVLIKEVKVNPDELSTIPETMEILDKGKLKNVTYTVVEGDTVSTILEKYNLTEEKLLELNPQIDKESLTIKVGQEIIVPDYVPYINVIVTEQRTEEKEIDYTTKYVETDELYVGDEEVVEEGKPGVKKVEYEVIKVNGKEQKRKIIKEEVLEEPVEEVIEKGTKEYEPVQQSEKMLPSQTMKSPGMLGWPTAGGFITSHMGPRWGGYHNGIDISGVSNRTIFAAADGVVTTASYQNNGYGNRVVITHSNGLVTTYSHLSSIAVQSGQTVQKGQAIGVMGATGNSTGVHLHFEVYQNGSIVNPMNFY